MKALQCASISMSLLLAGVLVGCSPPSEAGFSTEGPLEMSDAAAALRVVTLIAETDGRERAVGHIRALNGSEDAAAVVRSVALRNAQNAEVGELRLLRLESFDDEVGGMGYPVPPLRGDDGYERTGLLWDASIEAAGAHIAAGEHVNLVVGLVRPDATKCSVIDGIEVLYEADGDTYVASWNTQCVVELVDTAGCERADRDG